MRVLLVSHEASRSGAPRVGVLVAKSLVESGHFVCVVCRSGGPLIDDFIDVAPTSIEFMPRVRRRLRGHGLTRGLALVADTVVAAATILRHRPDLVYVNSTASATYLRPARWLRRRIVLHVHESGEIGRKFLGSAHAAQSLPGVELIACSPSVQWDLADLVGRDPLEIQMLPSVPDSDEVIRMASQVPDFTYGSDYLVVGCCGSVEARKGVDLWVAAVRLVMSARPHQKLRFVWVGDISEPVFTLPGEPIEFVGPAANPYAYMSRFDIGTLPSRDDPFPLVVLESMLLGTPMVAFSVGGVPQQIGDAGILIDPGDVNKFAEGILELVDDPDARARLGAVARNRVAALYSVSTFTDSLLKIVEGDRALNRYGRRSYIGRLPRGLNRFAELAHWRDAKLRRCKNGEGPRSHRGGN